VLKLASRLFIITLLTAGLHAVAAVPPQIASATYLKRLSVEELMMMDITSVSRRPEAFAATASAISVITGDDIRRSGATTIADALRWSTGLSVARIDGRTWGIASRGFNNNASNKLLVLMDGRSLYTPLFSGAFWDAQDTELADIDRIEVVRGPGATMWGANAVNGVINIQTKNARDTQGGLVTIGGGDEEHAFASMRQGFTLGKNVFARVYAKSYDRDDLVFPDGRDTSDDAEMIQGGFRIDVAPDSSTDSVTIQGDIYQGFLGGSNKLETRIAGGNLLAHWNHTFSPGQSISTQVYYDRVERSVPLQFSERRDTVDFETHYNAALGERHQFLAGVTARRSADRTGTTGTVRFSPADRAMTVISGLLQDEVSFWDRRLGVTVGSKFEHNSSSGGEFQPSIRAAFHPTPHQTLWAAASRALRTPTRFDDDLRFGASPSVSFVRGDPSFLPEKLTAYELGYRFSPLAQVAIDASVFLNQYDDLRSQERDTRPGALFVLRNKLNAETSGGEISVTVQATPAWRIRGTYAHLRKELSLDPDSTDPTRGVSEGNDPRHIATLVSSMDLPGHWEFDTMFRYVSKLPNPHVPAYNAVDLRLGWRPTPEWDFSIVGQNLFDSQHREFGASSPAAREVERSFYARITWRY
jgi:iron complex outermembrane receptor protein